MGTCHSSTPAPLPDRACHSAGRSASASYWQFDHIHGLLCQHYPSQAFSTAIIRQMKRDPLAWDLPGLLERKDIMGIFRLYKQIDDYSSPIIAALALEGLMVSEFSSSGVSRAFRSDNTTPFIVKELKGKELEGYTLVYQAARRVLGVPATVGATELFNDKALERAGLANFRLFRINVEGTGGQKTFALMPIYSTDFSTVPALKLKAAALDAAFDRVCSALSLLHRGGLAHCDVKPGNIFIHMDGRLMLGDFGSVRKIGSQVLSSTPEFLPVEFLRQSEATAVWRPNARAATALDYWMLACSMYDKAVEPARIRSVATINDNTVRDQSAILHGLESAVPSVFAKLLPLVRANTNTNTESATETREEESTTEEGNPVAEEYKEEAIV